MMRLRLVIERFGIPTVSILWTTAPLHPGQDVHGENTTVAQLLEHIDEVVPLESDHWGLDDYAVEVRGFECLHFLSLSQILRDDDEVTIRPLQTNDLRYRRLSGRHQIAADGKHLIDGVPFGRPYLRRVDRPRVRIHPRKRIWVMEGDEELDNFIDQRALPSAIQFEDMRDPRHGSRNTETRFSDGLGNDEQYEDDQDYVLDDNSEEDDDAIADDEVPAQEVQDLAEDCGGPSPSLLQDSGALGVSSVGLRRTSRKRPVSATESRGLGIQLRRPLESSDSLDLSNQNIWIGPYENPLLDEHYEDADHSRSKKVKCSYHQPGTRTVLAPRETRLASAQGSGEGLRSSQTQNVTFEEENATTPATIMARQGTPDSDDEEFQVSSETTSGSSESDKENVSPDEAKHPTSNSKQRGGHVERPIETGLVSPQLDNASSPNKSRSASADESSEDLTSSSGMSSSDSDSESTSDSDSDFYPENRNPAAESSVTPVQIHKNSLPQAKTNKVNGKFNVISTIVTVRDRKAQPAPPGQGRKKTHMRNQRRRISLRIKKLKDQGKIPQKFNRNDYLRWEEQTSQQEQGNSVEMGQAVQMVDKDLAAALEKRKAELLRSNSGEASGQVASNETLQTIIDDRSHVTSNETLQAMVEDHGPVVPTSPGAVTQNRVVHDQTVPDEVNRDSLIHVQQTSIPIASSASIIPSVPEDVNATPSLAAADITPNKRRTKLDVTSSRRLLFGSLGVRAPKTQEEADAVRQKLSANKKVAPQPTPSASLKPVDTKPEDVEADDSWKEKIALKAVECCHEGVELSTPPFPFKQRWDPQQRGDFHGRRSSKKQKRRASQYYENSKFEESQERYVYEGNHDTDFQGGKVSHDKESNLYPTLSEEYQSAANEQLLRDSGVLTTNGENANCDLPELPTNIQTYAALIPDTALRGSIVAFKQLEVSARTCWQPQVSEYRMAAIENVPEAANGGTFCLRLTSHGQEENAAKFDARTGERIYGKFEMPISNEDDDSNYLEITLDEMIEPKLVKASPTVTNQGEKLEQESTEPASLVQVEETPQEDSIDGAKRPQAEEHPRSTSFVEDSISHDRCQEPDNIEKPPSSDCPNSVSRTEVSLLIRDAGFRTDIDPEATRELGGPDKSVEGADKSVKVRTQDQGAGDDNDDDDHDSIRFQTFSGFPASPPRIYDNKDDNDDDDNGDDDEREEVEEQENSGEEDYDDQGYKSVASRSVERDSNKDDAQDVDAGRIAAQKMEMSSHSMGWYAATLKGKSKDSPRSRQSSHDQPFDETGNNSFGGASSNRPFENTDISNLDGTTEISNLDGGSYDMIGTQAAPRLGTSSPNSLPSLNHMSPNLNGLPSVELSDQLPETIPPTSSKVNEDSSPHQRPFRGSSISSYSKIVADLDQSSSSIRQSRGRKTLVVRGGHESKRDTSSHSSSSSDSYRHSNRDTSSRSDSYKHSSSDRASDSDLYLPSVDEMLSSQPSSKRPITLLSSDPPRPEFSPPPTRVSRKGWISPPVQRNHLKVVKKSSQDTTPANSQQNISKEPSLQSSSPPPTRASRRGRISPPTKMIRLKSVKKSNQDASLAASQQNISNQPPSQSQTRIKEEPASQRRSLLDDDNLMDSKDLTSNDDYDALKTQLFTRTSRKPTEHDTAKAEAIIVDLTQDSDFQSPSGSEYGGGRESARGTKGKRSGARETQSFDGEGIGRDRTKATRKRVVERTRSRV